jgi:hypothetical protein
MSTTGKKDAQQTRTEGAVKAGNGKFIFDFANLK